MENIISILIDGTGLDIWGFAIMCAVSFGGSFITASLGLGGGLLVMATMASLLPPQVLIPLHGIVQLGSNAGRAAIMRAHILKHVIPPFLIGTVIGAAIGGNLVVTLPTALLQLVLGVFVLYATWGPKLKTAKPGKKAFFGIGLFGSLVTMFVGATGPLVAPFAAAAGEKRQEVVATHASMMTIQHGFKIITFGILGFAFGPYIPLLCGLLACGFIGTWVGKHMLNALPEKAFRIGLKTLITVLAIRLLFKGLEGWLG
ncbi:MAG: sulfite exporter TauE/SafE family protein [Rhodospirillales bacterium]|nr:sulfite exporter TauE/SafE family protein [Rhodospirillales bacterium]